MLAKVREEYRRLSPEEPLKKVYHLGAAYEINSFSCSEAVDIPSISLIEVALKATTATLFSSVISKQTFSSML